MPMRRNDPVATATPPVQPGPTEPPAGLALGDTIPPRWRNSIGFAVGTGLLLGLAVGVLSGFRFGILAGLLFLIWWTDRRFPGLIPRPAAGPALGLLVAFLIDPWAGILSGLLLHIALFARFFRVLLGQFIPILGWSLPGAFPALVGVALFQTTDLNGDILVEAATKTSSFAFLFVALVYWSLQCWHWSRALIRAANEPLDYAKNRYRNNSVDWQALGRPKRLRWHLSLWMPRVVGLLPIFAAWWGVIGAATDAQRLIITFWFFVFSAVALSLMICRLRIVAVARRRLLVYRRARRRSGRSNRAAASSSSARTSAQQRLWPLRILARFTVWLSSRNLMREAPLGPEVALLLLASPVAFAIAAWAWPIELPQSVGPGVVVPLGLGSLTVPLAILFAVGLGFDAPVAAMAAIFFGFVIANTEFSEITRRPRSTPEPVRLLRPSIDAWARDWIRHCHANATIDGEFRVVLVATAGGAARAGLWTSQVLARLQHDTGSLHRHLFAIGGVSGGALGGVVHVADLAGNDASCTGEPPAGLAQRSRDFFSHDFLSPSLARHLSSDTYKRVLLFPLRWREQRSGLLHDHVPADRAAILEQAWVEGWRTAGGRLGLDSSLFDVYRDHPGLPLLMTQGTHGSTGRPAVTSFASIPERHLAIGFDLVDLLDSDISLATTASNAARFPYISPAGAIRGPSGPPKGYIVDGGYFENFGALSVLVAADALRLAHADWVTPNRPKLRILFVQISSTPDSDPRDLPRCETLPEPGDVSLASLDATPGTRPTDQLLAPLLSIVGTQQGHALTAAWILAQEACPDGRRARPETAGYVHFAIPGPPATPRTVPLNWTLPEWARDYLYAGTDQRGTIRPAWADPDNRAAAAAVRAFLVPPAGSTSATQPN